MIFRIGQFSIKVKWLNLVSRRDMYKAEDYWRVGLVHWLFTFTPRRGFDSKAILNNIGPK